MTRLIPRFRIATLLLVTACVAFGLWAIPEWNEYRRRMEFKEAVKRLSAGWNGSLFVALPAHSHQGSMETTQLVDAKHKYTAISYLRYQNYWYCLSRCPREPTDAERAERKETIDKTSPAGLRLGDQEFWSELKVYRLAPPPRGYVAQTDAAKRQHVDGKGKPVQLSIAEQYQADFLQVITGFETSDLGIPYKLIHSSSR